MKFRVYLEYGSDKRPCKEARIVNAVYLDWRTVPTLDIARGMHWGKDWFAGGKNHREEKGMVVREKDISKVWVVDIKSPEQMAKLVGDGCRIKITKDNEYIGLDYSIEIKEYL